MAPIKQIEVQQQAWGSNDKKINVQGKESVTGIDTTAEVAPTTSTTGTTATHEGFISIQSLVGMTAYDSEAMLVGRVLEIGLRKSPRGEMDISIKISKQENSYNNSDPVIAKEVLWKNISKIGDIVLLSERMRTAASSSPSQCACGYKNEEGAAFCEECGKKLG